ncbi:MAG: NHLP leader peptide family RiPP precursor [Rubrobacteraceae bacterium]
MTEAGGTPSGTPKEMRQRLIQRTVEDQELRQRLLDDPRATIEQELGAPLPAEVEVRAVEETQDTVYLVLPYKPQVVVESGELSEEELQKVSGAGWGSTGGPQECSEGTCGAHMTCDSSC